MGFINKVKIMGFREELRHLLDLDVDVVILLLTNPKYIFKRATGTNLLRCKDLCAAAQRERALRIQFQEVV